MIESTIKRVFVIRKSYDMRKGPSSLTAVAYQLGLNPYRGDTLIFLSKAGHSIKVLGGNHIGVWLVQRRYEGGRLACPWDFLSDVHTTEITVGQLSMLFEGQSFIVTKRTRPFHKI